MKFHTVIIFFTYVLKSTYASNILFFILRIKFTTVQIFYRSFYMLHIAFQILIFAQFLSFEIRNFSWNV